ncbi:peroxisomal targeting signal 1 receptor isoform X2 [Venturia canescens]|uniref:peroxisomal targeting signal 1 receptor isoform X2 n=1 Tax=Venturia canescens TaxID=32260 RepID=UPI001C9C3841|nr:peroxisomal targeting signal 1 receptor isoform X2 [Venturia canescens]
MSLHDLVDGECAGPSSLIRLTSHLIQDHGFQEEGLQRAHTFPQPHVPPNAEQFVEQFLEETNNASPQTFKMDNILREMQKIEYDPRVVGANLQRHSEMAGCDAAWASQYLASGRHFAENHTDAIWNSSYSEVVNNGAEKLAFEGNTTNELGLGPLWADEYLEHSVNLDNNIITKNDPVTYDTEVPKNTTDHSKLMKYMSSKESEMEAEKLDGKLDGNSDSYEKWIEEATNGNSVLDGNGATEIGSAEAWADELKQENAMTMGEWNKISSLNNLVDAHPWLPEYEKYYDPFNEYKFNVNNPMRSINNALEEGKRRLEAGDLPSAVLCFEAAVQEDPKNAEAWLILGKTQAENEQDPMAICALKNCLQIDSTNSVALMALAISYTNESYQNQACLTLKEWLSKHEKYKHLVDSSSDSHRRSKSDVSTILFNDVHNEVKDLFIKAARINPRDGIDPDVQSGLGVLFNLSCEYDKAADCFQAALNAQPNDCRLWNRYGATLANGQRSEEAVTAYHRALELSPGFIRARYNLGISCINLGVYKEAAEHLLTALNQQAAGRGVEGERGHPGAMSDTIWSTLRLVLSLMHKYNLNDAVEAKDLATLIREFEIE